MAPIPSRSRHPAREWPRRIRWCWPIRRPTWCSGLWRELAGFRDPRHPARCELGAERAIRHEPRDRPRLSRKVSKFPLLSAICGFATPRRFGTARWQPVRRPPSPSPSRKPGAEAKPNRICRQRRRRRGRPMTQMLFRDDAYLTHARAGRGAYARGRIVSGPLIFYPTGGGQPGDSGRISWSGVRIGGHSVKTEGDRLRLCRRTAGLPPVGTMLSRHWIGTAATRHMRVHTALHLLSVVIPAAGHRWGHRRR